MSFNYKNLCRAEFLAKIGIVQYPTVLIAAPHLIALSWFSPRPTSKIFKKCLELENGLNFDLCKVMQLACTCLQTVSLGLSNALYFQNSSVLLLPTNSVTWAFQCSLFSHTYSVLLLSTKVSLGLSNDLVFVILTQFCSCLFIVSTTVSNARLHFFATLWLFLAVSMETLRFSTKQWSQSHRLSNINNRTAVRTMLCQRHFKITNRPSN